MSSRIKGIRSVDFVITATGQGIVNHNGSFSVWNPAAGQVVANHMFPKLRGLDPLRRLADKEGAGVTTKSFRLDDPALDSAAVVVSANCVRSFIFKDASFGLKEVTRELVATALCSVHGLVRGYLVTNGNASFPRKSALYLTDLECAKPGLRFNQGAKSGTRTKTSLFSHFATDDNLQYAGAGSLSVEDLQFVPLENTLGRSAYSETVSIAEGEALAQQVTQYLQDLSGIMDAQVSFVLNAVRRGAIANKGEAGLLLNDAAIDVLVKETLGLISDLYIRQGKGHLVVTDVLVDYNDGQPMRVERDRTDVVSGKTQLYAQYFESRPMAQSDFEVKMAELKIAEAERAKLAKNKKDESVERTKKSKEAKKAKSDVAKAAKAAA